MSSRSRACKTCRVTKTLTDFYFQEGRYRLICKKCHIAKSEGQRDQVKKALWHAARALTVKRVRKSSAEDRVRRRASTKRWSAENPDRRKAHSMVQAALNRGDLVRPWNCAKCRATGRIEASHTDYTKPLEVEWLCVPCHRRKDQGKWIHLLTA